MAKANGKVRKKRRAKGWVPDQHGAWFMVTVPVLTGVLLAPAWIQLPLLVTWWAGYFAFFAAGIWMRSRFRANNRPPVLVYGAVTAVAGVVTLIMDWTLLVWAPAFIPLVAIAVYETWKRRPRSLPSGVATVIAACLMLPVMAWAGGGLDARAWLIFAVYAVYFTGTVPYVKTLIRERGDREWFRGSVIYHALAVAAAAFVNWVMVVLALVLVARAAGMPIAAGRRGTPVRPKTVGLIEAAITVIIAVAAWFTIG